MNKHFLGKCTFVHWYCLALAILLWLPITILEAAPSQNLKVSGIVTSATDGEPLIGVSVQVKGTSTGTITDLNGKYTLNVSTGHWSSPTSALWNSRLLQQNLSLT